MPRSTSSRATFRRKESAGFDCITVDMPPIVSDKLRPCKVDARAPKFTPPETCKHDGSNGTRAKFQNLKGESWRRKLKQTKSRLKLTFVAVDSGKPYRSRPRLPSNSPKSFPRRLFTFSGFFGGLMTGTNCVLLPVKSLQFSDDLSQPQLNREQCKYGAIFCWRFLALGGFNEFF